MNNVKGGISNHFFNTYNRQLDLSGWFLPGHKEYDLIEIYDSNENCLSSVEKTLYRYDAIKSFNYNAQHARCGWESSFFLPTEATDLLTIRLLKNNEIKYSQKFKISNYDKTDKIMKISKDQISKNKVKDRNDFERSKSYEKNEVLKKISDLQLPLIEKRFDLKRILDFYFNNAFTEACDNDSVLALNYSDSVTTQSNLSIKQVQIPKNRILTENEKTFFFNNNKHESSDLIYAKTFSPIFTQNELDYILSIFNRSLKPGSTAVLQDLAISNTNEYLVNARAIEKHSSFTIQHEIEKDAKVYLVTENTEQVVLQYLTPEDLASSLKNYPDLNAEIIYFSNFEEVPFSPSFSLSIQKRV